MLGACICVDSGGGGGGGGGGCSGGTRQLLAQRFSYANILRLLAFLLNEINGQHFTAGKIPAKSVRFKLFAHHEFFSIVVIQQWKFNFD